MAFTHDSSYFEWIRIRSFQFELLEFIYPEDYLVYLSRFFGGGEICYAIGWEKNVRRREGGEWSRRGAKRSGISGTIGLSSFLVARSTPTRGWQPLNNRRSHVEVRYSYDHREPFSSGDTQLKSLIIQPLARALSVLPIAYNYIAAR